MQCIILFGFFDVIQNIFLTDTQAYKYMCKPCCGTGGILESVEIYVQTK